LQPDDVFAATETLVADGAFQVYWNETFERATYQNFFAYIDADGDGVCSPTADHVMGGPTNSWNLPNAGPNYLEVSPRGFFGRALEGEDAERACENLNGC
jgi:hypothetical protein